MTTLCSTGDEHCCWLKGKPCEYLRENAGGRRWLCVLRHELGMWGKVHDDPRYQPIHEYLSSRGVADCGVYPGPDKTCGACGEVG